MLNIQCICIFKGHFHHTVGIHAVPGYGGFACGECDELRHIEITTLVDTFLDASSRTQQCHQDEHTPTDGKPSEHDALAVALHGGFYLFYEILHFSSLNITPSLK